MTRRRSRRPNLQIHLREEGLHPQTQTSEDGAGVTKGCRRGRGTSLASTATLPDDDDMLREIFLRLPPQPSSLFRASAVCNRWRGLVTDPRFLRQFYAHHRKPPLLGLFVHSGKGIVFKPLLDPPDRIPRRRFNLGRCSRRFGCNLLDCRHGRVLVEDWKADEIVVCNPITGEQRRIAITREFRRGVLSGAVLCAAANHGHVHGSCHSSPFKVVLLSTYRSDNRYLAYVYSSETNVWGNLITMEATGHLFDARPQLIGNCLYWLCFDGGILEFDLGKKSLTVILEPPLANSNILPRGNRQIIQPESGVVGLAIFCYPHFHMWHRNVNDHGVATWTPWKTIEIRTILGLPPWIEKPMGGKSVIRGYDEDTDEICLNIDGGVYMVHIKSIQSRKLDGAVSTYHYHPFKSFYTPGDMKGLCS